LSTLQDEGNKVMSSAIIDCILAVLLIISFVINCATIGKPLREKKKKVVVKDKKIYGQLSNEKNID
jgi:hypothetical protein